MEESNLRRVHCIHCSSDDVEYKSDITQGCCETKVGEIWQCNNCGKDMVIQVVYTDDKKEVDCPHNDADHKCNCGDCDSKDK